MRSAPTVLTQPSTTPSSASSSEFRYLSADEHVATVTKDGTITAKGAGTCKIYVIANNGVYKGLNVTVNGTK